MDDPVESSSSPAQPTATASSSSSKPKAKNGGSSKLKTLRDLNSSADDEDEDDPDRKRDLFAGGGKSGLAVTDPNNQGGSGGARNHFEDIMEQARQNRDRPGGDDEDEAGPAQSTRASNFSGRAQTLGGDDAPSRVVDQGPTSTASRAQPPPRVTRTLHLWDDGFSIDDGALFRFDDPANEALVAQIRQGRAPLSLLDVQPDQEVDLQLNPHQGEKYVAPKPKYKPFGGQGQRLGSPTPSSTTTTQQPQVTTGTASSATPATQTSTTNPQAATTMPVDENTPTLQLQIRLGDGSRLVSRFNTTHTIGDVYDFVNRASTASQSREWALMTTFPSKELNDKSVVLGEMGDFKRGGTVVQKWK